MREKSEVIAQKKEVKLSEMSIPESIRPQNPEEHPIFNRLYRAWEVAWDIALLFQNELATLPLQEENETVFAIVYSRAGTSRIIPLGFGYAGEAEFDAAFLAKLRSEYPRVVMYHTHSALTRHMIEPSSQLEMARRGEIPPRAVFPPSIQDLKSFVRRMGERRGSAVGRETFGIGRETKPSEERILSPLWVWSYSIMRGFDPVKVEQKLDTVYASLLPGMASETKVAFNAQDPNEFFKIAFTYTKMVESQEGQFSERAVEDTKKGNFQLLAQELALEVQTAKVFAKELASIGLEVRFELHKKYERYLSPSFKKI